jgi:hypothetical protein
LKGRSSTALIAQPSYLTSKKPDAGLDGSALQPGTLSHFNYKR